MLGAGGQHGHGHWTEVAYTLFSDAAVAKVSAIASIHASIVVHEPAHLRPFGADGPAVLAFGFSHPQPTPRVTPNLPQIELEPYQRFLDEQADAAERNHVELDPEVEPIRIGSLAWLAGELKAPTAFWHHEGYKGLDYEYAWGLGERPMKFYNEREDADPMQSTDIPAGALTACFWHLGVHVDNRGEASWGQGPAYRHIVHRPFVV